MIHEIKPKLEPNELLCPLLSIAASAGIGACGEAKCQVERCAMWDGKACGMRRGLDKT